MDANQARLRLLERNIKARIDGFKVRWKDRSRGQRLIGKLMFWNRRYMKEYISTFYPVVYWPTEKEYLEDPVRSFKVLAHEYVHLYDAAKGNARFSFLYIMPHWLILFSLVSLLSIWFSLWWLLGLSALVFALPWPAYWRMRYELRAYTMSMAVNAWKHGSIWEQLFWRLEKEFTGWAYYRMWPFKKSIRRRLKMAEERIHNGDVLLMAPIFQDVKDIVTMSDDDVIMLAEGS